MRLDSTRFVSTTAVGDIAKHTTVFFIGTDYPFLFFMQLRKGLARVGLMVETIDAAEMTVEELKGRLATQFLGQSCIYIMTSFGEDNNLLSYVTQYKGPHTLVAYIPREWAEKYDYKGLVIDCAATVDKALFSAMARWFDISATPGVERFIQQLFNRHDHISFEAACLLMYYVPLGIYEPAFFEEWLEVVVAPAQSMFNLSTSLFQKNGDTFFKLWKHMAESYSAPFWIAFWSEQLWRASMFVTLNKQRKYTDARKIAFRLPFAFINKDWHNYTADELAAAHDFIYRLDGRLKNGGSDVGLDLFYAQFLSNKFACL